MKTFLMHPDRDFDAEPPSPKQPIRFAQDIELNVLLDAAAAGDRYLFDIMAAACSGAWMNDIATVRYRQEILKDCIANPSIVRQFYAIAIEPFGRERSWNFSLWGRDASTMVASGVRTLQSSLEVRAAFGTHIRRRRIDFRRRGFGSSSTLWSATSTMDIWKRPEPISAT